MSENELGQADKAFSDLGKFSGTLILVFLE